MKSRWDFIFETNGFHFERTHRYRGTANIREAPKEDTLPCQRTFEIEIVPDGHPVIPRVEQTGHIYVVLDGEPEITEQFAYWVAGSMSTKISFTHGRMALHSGLVFAERIPETEEEKMAIGDTPYFATVRLIEAEMPKPYDSSSLDSLDATPEALTLMDLYTTAVEDTNPVDSFVGLCRILERLYCGTVYKSHLERGLRASQEFRDIATEVCTTDPSVPFSEADCKALIKDIVRVRGGSAHLYGKTGYLPDGQRTKEELEPLLRVVGQIAREAIRRRTEVVAKS